MVVERRRRNLKAFLCQFSKGRRRRERRKYAQHHGHYVDLHEPKLLLITLSILLLCVVDIYFTLTLLQNGGVELNPFMRALLEQDVWLFYLGKYTLTAVCLIFLVAHKHFRLFKNITGRDLLQTVLLAYLLLIGYELSLLSLIPGYSWTILGLAP